MRLGLFVTTASVALNIVQGFLPIGFTYKTAPTFTAPQTHTGIFPLLSRTKSASAVMASTYDSDSDEASFRHRSASNSIGSASEASNYRRTYSSADVSPDRYEELIREVGLEGKLMHASKLPPRQKMSCRDIFCNRELRMAKISSVGFDMDYTLAQYHQPAFDLLAFNGAKQKMVEKLGYPKEVLDFEYNHTHWTRGLIIDTERGNFLKIDRHRYVRVANHGLTEISSALRKELYSKNFNKVESFTEKSYINMDTLFQFVHAHLFALLVEMKDRSEHDFFKGKSYASMYKDIHTCVDLCHRDGHIKDEVARNPEKYVVLDEGMISMLRRFRDFGVKTFLLTNSFWDHTSAVMNFLYHGKKVDMDLQRKNEWIELFDLCIVGSCKPAFMLDKYLQLYRLNTEDGSLLNTDGLYEIDALGENGAQKFLDRGKVFQGGNWQHLHKMLEVDSGDEILYVGDHLYSDVLRSKRTLGWRSLFIMPELEDEIRVFHHKLPMRLKIERLRLLREELLARADELRSGLDADSPETKKLLNEMSHDDGLLKSALAELASRWHAAFHPIWGAMFNAGYQGSRFAFYVENYACLYTSKASNLGLISKQKCFRTAVELVPHDRMLALGAELLPTDPLDS
eukprot:Nitzschia sp. Nitz4//scaffold33_size148984//21076//23231//NITZ4_002913-RA/size148984-processed-gene-0.156-mRNA-1//-1//CDS//3329548382//5399//frame0